VQSELPWENILHDMHSVFGIPEVGESVQDIYPICQQRAYSSEYGSLTNVTEPKPNFSLGVQGCSCIEHSIANKRNVPG